MKISKVWDWTRNKISGNDDGSNEPWKQFTRGSKKQVWVYCQKHKYHIYKTTCMQISKSSGCPYCQGIKVHPLDSIAQYIINMYGKESLYVYINKEKNKEDNINPWKLNKKSENKIWFNCINKNYHIYKMSCRNFYKGSRCKYCGRTKYVHPLDSLGEYLKENNLLDLWSDRNKKSPFEYTKGTEKKIWLKCPCEKHKDHYQQVKNAMTSNFKCPKCIKEQTESLIEEKVRLYLESLNLGQVLHEYDCTLVPINPKTKYKMPFDNEIIINNTSLIIEVNGSQHYYIDGWGENNKIFKINKLHKRQLYDRYKRIYAKIKGYEYLEISYRDIQNNDNYKNIINDKINKIINND